MSQCHDPYDVLEEVEPHEVRNCNAPSLGAQCHDYYDDGGGTTSSATAGLRPQRQSSSRAASRERRSHDAQAGPSARG